MLMTILYIVRTYLSVSSISGESAYACVMCEGRSTVNITAAVQEVVRAHTELKTVFYTVDDWAHRCFLSNPAPRWATCCIKETE